MFEYKCMHLFSNTKCIFKYKCMHVYARGYGISATKKVILATEELITATLFLILFFSLAAAKVKFDTEEVIRATLKVISATTDVILATDEVIISTLKVISVTTKRDETWIMWDMVNFPEPENKREFFYSGEFENDRTQNILHPCERLYQ